MRHVLRHGRRADFRNESDATYKPGPALHECPEAAGHTRWAAWADELRAAEGLEPGEELSIEASLEHAREAHPDEVEAIEAEYEEATAGCLADVIPDQIDLNADLDSLMNVDPAI